MFQLLFPRWQKKDRRFDKLTWLIAFVLAIVIGFAIPTQSPEQSGAIAILFCLIIRFALLFLLNRYLANTLIGAERVRFTDMDRAIETVLTSKSIAFERDVEPRMATFSFPKHQVSLTVVPRANTSSDPDVKKKPTCEVTIHPVTASNASFVSEIQTIVEEIADRRASAKSIKRRNNRW